MLTTPDPPKVKSIHWLASMQPPWFWGPAGLSGDSCWTWPGFLVQGPCSGCPDTNAPHCRLQAGFLQGGQIHSRLHTSTQLQVSDKSSLHCTDEQTLLGLIFQTPEWMLAQNMIPSELIFLLYRWTIDIVPTSKSRKNDHIPYLIAPSGNICWTGDIIEYRRIDTINDTKINIVLRSSPKMLEVAYCKRTMILRQAYP